MRGELSWDCTCSVGLRLMCVGYIMVLSSFDKNNHRFVESLDNIDDSRYLSVLAFGFLLAY